MILENVKTFIKDAFAVEEVTDEQANNVQLALNELSDREERAVRLYYGLDDRPRTYAEVARHFEVDEETVREILRKSGIKMRLLAREIMMFGDK